MKLLVEDYLYGEVIVEGEVLEDMPTFYTLKDGDDTIMVWKHLILEEL